jgi:hypothetical protein
MEDFNVGACFFDPVLTRDAYVLEAFSYEYWDFLWSEDFQFDLGVVDCWSVGAFLT